MSKLYTEVKNEVNLKSPSKLRVSSKVQALGIWKIGTTVVHRSFCFIWVSFFCALKTSEIQKLHKARKFKLLILTHFEQIFGGSAWLRKRFRDFNAYMNHDYIIRLLEAKRLGSSFILCNALLKMGTLYFSDFLPDNSLWLLFPLTNLVDFLGVDSILFMTFWISRVFSELFSCLWWWWIWFWCLFLFFTGVTGFSVKFFVVLLFSIILFSIIQVDEAGCWGWLTTSADEASDT